MKILVVAATQREIAPFILCAEETDILITGVGVPACMYLLTKQFQRKTYDIAIQAGIAGTYKTEYAPGNTVFVRQDIFADLGIQEAGNFYTLFDKKFADGNITPYTNERLLNTDSEFFSLPGADAITINTVSDKISQREMYVKKYDPDIETMEGAAFHYVCISERIRFLQIRGISNFVGERENWKMEEAIESLNKNLSGVVKQLQNR